MTAEIDPTLWRIRVCLPGSILHLTSLTEPIVHMRNGRIHGVTMELETTAPEAGDTIGFIDWPAVVGFTWRRMKQPAKRTEIKYEADQPSEENDYAGQARFA
jgi:hypothetical protein